MWMPIDARFSNIFALSVCTIVHAGTAVNNKSAVRRTYFPFFSLFGMSSWEVEEYASISSIAFIMSLRVKVRFSSLTGEVGICRRLVCNSSGVIAPGSLKADLYWLESMLAITSGLCFKSLSSPRSGPILLRALRIFFGK